MTHQTGGQQFPRFRGIIVPMVTPLATQKALDLKALEQLIDRLLVGGVHGLFLLGTCGEGPSLSYELRRTLIDRTCRQAAGRIPVLVNVTDPAASEAMALAQFAAEAGAVAVVIAPPYYLPLSQAELHAYFVQQAAQSPLPVLLYNMPSLTKIVIEPETVRRLQDQPRIVGLKDSSGDLDYFSTVAGFARERADWSLLIGPEQLLVRSLELGGHGGVSGGANLFPELFIRIFEAVSADRPDLLPRLLKKAKLVESVYESGPITAPTVIKGLKAALAAMAIGNGLVAEPLQPLSAQDDERIIGIVRTLMAE